MKKGKRWGSSFLPQSVFENVKDHARSGHEIGSGAVVVRGCDMYLLPARLPEVRVVP
jgi:hypothetical protein